MSKPTDQKRGFSGWQRLFVVASVIWLGVCSLIAYHTFPTKPLLEGGLMMKWLEASRELEQEKKDLEARCQRQGQSDGDFVRHGECIQQVRGTPAFEIVRERQKSIGNEFHVQVAALETELPKIQALALGKALLLWLVPSILVYVCVAWVYAGFKKHV